MQVIPANSLQTSNPLVPRDFSDDYRNAEVFAEQPLLLPSQSEREAAFDAIEQQLAVPRTTLQEIFTAIADGKHVLLYGPPGTGKTTLASLIADRVFGVMPQAETANADWTSFETVGGLQLELFDGNQQLTPKAGVITESIVRCLTAIASNMADPSDPQATWLLLDELNRANVDAAFGPLFTALDAAHRTVSLPFFDEQRRTLIVPRRYRIIATMNSYDKNFLFRLSYALMRRFALIAVEPPRIDDAAGRAAERRQLAATIAAALNEHGESETSATVEAAYGSWLLTPLHDVLAPAIRDPDGLDRGIGFAQLAAAARFAAMMERFFTGSTNAGRAEALDCGVRANIVPQLEGLPNNALVRFLRWWDAAPDPLPQLATSIRATRLLMRGTDLFTAE